MNGNAEHTKTNNRRWIAITIHVLLWLVIFLLPYFITPYEPQPHTTKLPRPDFRELNTLTKFFWVVLFYLNAFVLVPRLLYKRRFLIYVISLACCFAVIMAGHSILFKMLYPDRHFVLQMASFFNFFPFAFTIILSMAFKSINDQITTERVRTETQNENLKTELSFLRSQISPHFLFNVMNNIVAMVRLKSDELEPTVMKLSSLMRYMLYETDEERVLLTSEVEYLQSFIDLQKQRFGPELQLFVDLDIEENGHTIEPMLLIPFVENAFKHGNGLVTDPYIEIRLSVENDKLDFIVKNKFREAVERKEKTSGIGLNNVNRRLELLYPGTYNLTLQKADGWFTAHLQVTLR